MQLSGDICVNSELDKPEFSAVLNTAMEAGHILLENGAEISRVEETMQFIATQFGVTARDDDFFVLANGIFTTGSFDRKDGFQTFAKVKHIPVKGTRIDKIVAVNQLSREIGEGKYTLPEVQEKLQEIRNQPAKSPVWQILASGVGAAAFCILFGGSLWDSAASFVAGFLLWIFVLKISSPYLSKITGNLFGGALVSIICVACYKLGLGLDLNHMIIGSIIPLVPGMAFFNGIRDIADGDYLAGAVRLMDACIIFLCIAIGVGMVILFCNSYFHIL